MLSIQEKNPCPNNWHNEFLHGMWPKILPNYDYVRHVVSDYRDVTILKAGLHHTVYESPRRFLDMYNIIDSTPYYYINYLLEIEPPEILDIGCGDNVFKKSFPELIVGMDSGQMCDRIDVVDLVQEFNADFVANNKNTYHAIMSMNCIHFSPISEITKRLQLVAQLLKPRGRAFVSFSVETWLMFTGKKEIEMLFGLVPKFEDILNYIDRQIVNTGLDFLVVDWPILKVTKYSSIRDDYNGNIRLVFSV